MAEAHTDHQVKTVTGRCLVVFGTKGGVGKTVVATNLAVSFAERLRQPIALVDLDTMAAGDVAKMLGVNPPHVLVDLLPQLKRSPQPGELPLDGIVAQHKSGVHVVQGIANPRQSHALEAGLLQQLLRTLRSRYEYVIVDAGKGLTDPLIAAFDEANLILLVTTPDVVSLYQTKWAMNIIESLLFPPHMVKGVLNRAESRGGVASQDVRLAMPCDLISEIPSDGRAVGSAVNQGEPVVSAYAYTRVAEAFRRLADTLISQPSLFVSHQEIPRHRSKSEGAAPVATDGLSGSARLFAASQEAASARQKDDEIVQLKRRIHEQLVAELDLKKVDLAALSNEAHMREMRERCERVIANLLSRELGGIISSHEVRTRLVKEITDEALGLGPLEELLDDPGVSDILVNGKDQIYVERRGRLELTTKKFISDDQVRAVIERIVAPLGRRIDESNPMVDARLPDGSRVNAIIPPLSVRGPSLSIRKFGDTHLGQKELMDFGSFNQPMADFLRACVMARKNIVISGGTGSGKTTLLNLLAHYIPEHERILTIEDAAELRLPQTHWICLEARPANVEGKGQVSIRDLFRNALRMRPDRIVIGECRGPESLDMLQAMNTGHEGSLTTVHANSPRDVVSRLDSMVLMSNIELPIEAIHEMVASAVHLVVHTGRLSDGSRKILSISELTGIKSQTEVAFQDIFTFRQTGVESNGKVLGEFHATGRQPTFLEELKVKGILLDAAMFRAPDSAPTRNG